MDPEKLKSLFDTSGRVVIVTGGDPWHRPTELAPFGIRVNALSPGTVGTDMARANSPERQDVMANVMLMAPH